MLLAMTSTYNNIISVGPTTTQKTPLAPPVLAAFLVALFHSLCLLFRWLSSGSSPPSDAFAAPVIQLLRFGHAFVFGRSLHNFIMVAIGASSRSLDVPEDMPGGNKMPHTTRASMGAAWGAPGAVQQLALPRLRGARCSAAASPHPPPTTA